LKNAFDDFLPVSTKAYLGLKGDLDFDPVLVGKVTSLHLRGVVGFTDVLMRLIITFDAELCRSEKADIVLENRLKAATKAITMSANRVRRERKVAAICVKATLPKPENPTIVHSFMVERGIVKA